jgi:hypothetical protein
MPPCLYLHYFSSHMKRQCWLLEKKGKQILSSDEHNLVIVVHEVGDKLLCSQFSRL